MQNVIDKIEWMFAGLGGFLGWFFGGFDGFLYALVVFVVCDYFTGVLAAAIKHELSSEVGFKGIAKKVCIRNHHPAIISEELWQEAQEVWKVYTAKYRGIEKGRNERNYSKLLLCEECGRYFQGHSTTRTTIWRCATKLAQQGQKRCRMEPIYEEQIQMLLCKAFAEKFKLGEKMDAEVHEVMQMISQAPIDNARNQALKNLTEKLREIHDFDHMEQEGDFLKRQLSAVNYSIRDAHQRIRDIQAEKEALKVRCEVLGEPIDKEAVTELENRLLNCLWKSTVGLRLYGR